MSAISKSTWALFRIASGLLFMQHGLQKLFGWYGGLNGGVAPIASQMGVAGMLELGGGALLVFGLLTRAVAFVLFCEMIAAYFMAHMPQGGAPIQNQGELALLYAGIFLFFVGNGAGAFSLDALMPVNPLRDRRRIADRRSPIVA